jgi:replicative DNA helicase
MSILSPEEFEIEKNNLHLEHTTYEAYQAFEALKVYDGEDKIISSHDALTHVKSFPPHKYIKTGLDRFDALTNGLKVGEIVILSGMTGTGKTTWAKTMTYNLSTLKNNCLWFTFEVCLEDFLDSFPSLPLFYLPQKHIAHDLLWIKQRIVETKLKYECDELVVFIDHLHYLVKFSQVLNTSFLIGGIMRELKKMAIELQCVIVLIAHTQKVSPEATVDISHLRDSSFVSQEADYVFFVRRNGTLNKLTKEIIYSDEGTLHLLKNRRTGRLGKINLLWRSGLFIENNAL